MQYRAGGRFKNTRGVITNVVETICHLDWNCVTLKCRITEQCQISTQWKIFLRLITTQCGCCKFFKHELPK